ncbi:restriction endonuclease subunit S [Pediococcus acidilactici]|uniref:restriction endonuclease subunit S n=1 Tax=Pediococcus acidilactici TaxID=1254 RepID=UPI0027085135|nr:restriction endonuclease subunit S [Pediococcus acidilactici]MDO7803130.1 restriction endonuclease subunit S [Pediococcus acidilactici]
MKDNQAKYPQLRFKGFTDPWEKRSLDEITTKTKSYSLSRDVERDHETGYRYIHYGDIHTGVADIVTEHTNLPNIEPANYDELRVNDLVVADASEDYQGIAEPAVVVGLPTQHLVAGLHTIALRPSSASSLYLYYLLHTESFKHFGYQTGTGLKVFGISWSNLSKFTFMIPSRPEQEKIVKLIESVDNLTSDNQRKLAKLKELKQGYLQKMFPKNGSKFPQLRFAGFADAWEERKFEDLLDSKDGVRRGPFGSALKKEFFVENSEYVVYEQQNAIYDNYHTRYKITKEKFDELSKFKLNPGDFIMSGAGTIGRISRVPDGVKLGVFNQALIRFRINPEITDSEYFIQFVRADFMQKNLTGANPGSAITNLVPMSEVKKWEIKAPHLEEQEKIGSFFKLLDDTIALHQRKLEKLQELKKGYLQKMFC